MPGCLGLNLILGFVGLEGWVGLSKHCEQESLRSFHLLDPALNFALALGWLVVWFVSQAAIGAEPSQQSLRGEDCFLLRCWLVWLSGQGASCTPHFLPGGLVVWVGLGR